MNTPNEDKASSSATPTNALSSTAIDSIKDILTTPLANPHQLSVTPPKVKLSWLKETDDDDGDALEIIEEVPPPNRPAKSWRTSRLNGENVRELEISNRNNSRKLTTANVNNDDRLGSKPKLTNMSLLSTNVAHATLERCLLGCNRDELKNNNQQPSYNNSILSESEDSAETATYIDYSKQCKAGHVIDLLELRRLSSRGIPDEPPEHQRNRVRAASAPANNINDAHNNELLSTSSSAGNIQSSAGNPHRSYRPLVWRVLLGYLPPETSLWNEVLTRDRALYNNFVKEMFVTTCPAPHEMYNASDLEKRRVEEEEHVKTQEYLRGQQVFREKEDGDDEDEAGEIPPPPPAPPEEQVLSTPKLTQGLLSARMQQEWIHGDDVYQTPDDGSSEDGGGNGNSLSRISPLCAMNTPRTRSRKAMSVGSTISEEKSVPTISEVEDRSNLKTGEENVIDRMNNLLLPEDMEESKTQLDESRTNNKEVDATQLSTQDNQDSKPSITLSPSQDIEEEENILLLDEIRKDVIRTHPDLRFFLEPKEDLGQKRYAALERILFVWAKLNKGVRYVQGMNEIVGTLYFVLAHDSNEDWAKEAEADTYFLFNSIMFEMRDVFIPDLDESDSGIHGRISNMITLLALHDPEVRCHLDSVGIDPSFYSVRWLTTLLSREFLLPDTIRLWDSMFASTHKDNFLRYVSVTMVMVMRNQILEGDFSACLRLLQAFPPTNLDRLLESSRALWIYESQITLACHKGGISLGHALRSIAPPPAIIMAYGLHGGVAPQIREQVREAGQRGLKAARGAANGASNAGKSFLSRYWGSGNNREKKDKS